MYPLVCVIPFLVAFDLILYFDLMQGATIVDQSVTIAPAPDYKLPASVPIRPAVNSCL